MMNQADERNVALVRTYLAALERGEPIEQFFTADAVQTEFPNRLNPRGSRSDVRTMLERFESGKRLLQSQKYVVTSVVAKYDSVAVELEWEATVAIPVQTIPAGGKMRGHFAIFFEFVNGRIHRQRNYDNFDPW
jgi:ketosteroid isomerase-like protein